MSALCGFDPSFFVLTFYLLASSAHALPSSPPSALLLPPTIATANGPLSFPNVTTPFQAGRSMECFAPGTPRTSGVTVEDCEFTFEAIIRDEVGALHMTTFSHNPVEGEYEVPAQWQVGGCIVLLTSGDESATDTFALADVIVKAQQIIDECPEKSKTHLGGLALIGHGKTFFVAVNGPYADSESGGDGNDDGGWLGEVTNRTRLVLGQGQGGNGASVVERRAEIGVDGPI